MESSKPENTRRKKSKAATPKSRSAKAAYSSRLGASSPGKNPFSSKGVKSAKKSKKSDINLDSETDLADSNNESPNTSQVIENTPLSSPFPDGWETLLPCENRKPLPQIPMRTGRRCILEDTVNFYPAIYQQFISLLGSGVSINVACTCVGWNESTFGSWAYRGACDERDGKDTYFSRLHKDVRRAVASKTADCERQIAESSPAKWLTQGPGRIFGGRWSKPDPNKRLPAPNTNGATPGLLPAPSSADGTDPTEILDAAFTVQTVEGDVDDQEASEGTSPPGPRRLTTQGTSQAHSTLAITPQEELEALRVWESIGLVKLDPALTQAFNEQMTNQGEDGSKEASNGKEESK